MGIKSKKKIKKPKNKKLYVAKVNTHRKLVCFLWVLFIVGFCFAIYKNFTAIDIHTIHETKVIKEKIVDTNSIENFVINFAKVYYCWDASTINSINNRYQAIGEFLTDELQRINIDTIRKDIPVSSTVNSVQIWSVISNEKGDFEVVFSVEQEIKEKGENKSLSKMVQSYYKVEVHVDNIGNMVITRNPTIYNIPQKSSYKPKLIENNGSVDAVEANEIKDFLETFFMLYPTASTKELAYYVKDEVLKPVNKDYIFVELLYPTYNKIENKIHVFLYVKYIDQQTKAIQISQYNLKLIKDDNWKIVQ